jgi:hypothetical protein
MEIGDEIPDAQVAEHGIIMRGFFRNGSWEYNSRKFDQVEYDFFLKDIFGLPKSFILPR